MQYLKTRPRCLEYPQDLALVDLSFARFRPPKSSELRPINLSFEDSINLWELGGPKFSEIRSILEAEVDGPGLRGLGPKSSELKA